MSSRLIRITETTTLNKFSRSETKTGGWQLCLLLLVYWNYSKSLLFNSTEQICFYWSVEPHYCQLCPFRLLLKQLSICSNQKPTDCSDCRTSSGVCFSTTNWTWNHRHVSFVLLLFCLQIKCKKPFFSFNEKPEGQIKLLILKTSLDFLLRLSTNELFQFPPSALLSQHLFHVLFLFVSRWSRVLRLFGFSFHFHLSKPNLSFFIISRAVFKRLSGLLCFTHKHRLCVCFFSFIFLSAEKAQNNLDFLSLSRRTKCDFQIEQIEGLVAIPSVSPDSFR